MALPNTDLYKTSFFNELCTVIFLKSKKCKREEKNLENLNKKSRYNIIFILRKTKEKLMIKLKGLTKDHKIIFDIINSNYYIDMSKCEVRETKRKTNKLDFTSVSGKYITELMQLSDMKKMNDFIRGDYDVLIATTIIESGLLHPRVNNRRILTDNSQNPKFLNKSCICKRDGIVKGLQVNKAGYFI